MEQGHSDTINLQTRDGVLVKGKRIRHDTATRDYVCGVEGAPLTTRNTPAGWQTLCSKDCTHDPARFTPKAAWLVVQTRRAVEADQARQVFAHLPADLQAAIAG